MRYALTYAHLGCYVTTFYIASCLFFQYELYRLATSVVIGWSLYGIGTIGHDALHNSFSSNKTINKIAGFICLDMFIISSNDWSYLHNDIHHKYLHDERYIMGLNGKTFLLEFATVVYRHKVYDKQEKRWYVREFPKLPFLWYMYKLGVYSVVVFMVYMFCLSYFTYITHSYRKRSSHKSTSKQFHLDNTWDVYPKSHINSLISGGINAHATHHIYPNATRSEQMVLCDKIRDKYPEYRRIDTLDGLFSLFWYRGVTYG